MSETFKPGDVVVCVDDGVIKLDGWIHVGGGIIRNDIYRVSATDWDEDHGRATLWLKGVEGDKLACRFRHLPKATEQFTAQMRACRPVRERMPA